jgi:hypothetical protein
MRQESPTLLVFLLLILLCLLSKWPSRCLKKTSPLPQTRLPRPLRPRTPDDCLLVNHHPSYTALTGMQCRFGCGSKLGPLALVSPGQCWPKSAESFHPVSREPEWLAVGITTRGTRGAALFVLQRRVTTLGAYVPASRTTRKGCSAVLCQQNLRNRIRDRSRSLPPIAPRLSTT